MGHHDHDAEEAGFKEIRARLKEVMKERDDLKDLCLKLT
jgi:hypothetical protein